MSARGLSEGLQVSKFTRKVQNFVRRKRSLEEIEDEGVEFHPDEMGEIVLPDIDHDPYYKHADDSAGYANNHKLALEIQSDDRPRLSTLVDTCLVTRKEGNVLFEQGMWVEYRSNDMQWKVGLVNRVVKQAPDTWDFEKDGEPPADSYNIYYNVGVEGLLDVDDLRAPKEGLQVLFGKRPWLWQQFTLLQLERRIRFDESHEYDFDEIDCQEFGSDRFELWLLAPENADFLKLYNSQPDIAKELLKDHLLTPFNLCDKIVEDKEVWDFDDPDISLYTYTSVFGSGVITTFITVLIQVISPLIIFYNAMFLVDGEQNDRFIFEDGSDSENPEALDGAFLPDTDFDLFCETEDSKNPRFEGKLMIVIVLLVYVTTVIPDSILSWYRTSGGADSTYSKINSLRQIIWFQNDDDVMQQIGYKLDRIMNTGYVSALYTIMLFVLIQTPIILDIILNALAIEFIHEIDEKIANSDWYDDGNRWIRAGTIELVIQANLRLRILDSAKAICSEFEIDPKDYHAALNGHKSLNNVTLAEEDDNDYKYMTLKERKYKFVANEAKKNGNDFALEEYEKQSVQFGFVDIVYERLGIRKKGVFNRYPEYRTWSRWEKILFLPHVPAIDAAESSARVHRREAIEVTVGADDYTEFLVHVFLVLTGMDTFFAMRTAARNNNFIQVPIKFVLGVIEMIFYLIQLLFPLFIIPALFLVPYCY